MVKIVQWSGYIVGFVFIGVCALLTSSLSKRAEGTRPEPRPQSPSASHPVGFGWSLEGYFAARDADGDGRLSEEESASGWSSADPQRTEWGRRMFRAADADGDAHLTLGEVRASFERMRSAMAAAQDRFTAADADGDGRLTLDEALGSEPDETRHAFLSETFHRFDRDTDGHVDARELRIGVWQMVAER